MTLCPSSIPIWIIFMKSPAMQGQSDRIPFQNGKRLPRTAIGATFGVMPSIYEPFGSAVEYMANGTVNIGRATGDL